MVSIFVSKMYLLDKLPMYVLFLFLFWPDFYEVALTVRFSV